MRMRDSLDSAKERTNPIWTGAWQEIARFLPAVWQTAEFHLGLLPLTVSGRFSFRLEFSINGINKESTLEGIS